MFLDSETIKSKLFSVHPHFVENRDDNSKLYYYVPFTENPNTFLIFYTGINNKYPKTSFIEVKFFDNISEMFFGRKYIIKLNLGWEKELKKTILWLIKDLKVFKCNSCGNFMTAKINKFDKFFLACNNYPQCNGIKKIDEIKEFVL